MIRGSRHQINLTAIGVRCWNMKSSSYPLRSWLGQCCPLWGRLGRWLCLCRRKRPRVQGEEPYAQLLVQESPGAVAGVGTQGLPRSPGSLRGPSDEQICCWRNRPSCCKWCSTNEKTLYGLCSSGLSSARGSIAATLIRAPTTNTRWIGTTIRSLTNRRRRNLSLIKSPIRISKNLKILCSYMPYLLQIVHTTEFFTIGRAAKATPPGQSWSRVISQ